MHPQNHIQKIEGYGEVGGVLSLSGHDLFLPIKSTQPKFELSRIKLNMATMMELFYEFHSLLINRGMYTPRAPLPRPDARVDI